MERDLSWDDEKEPLSGPDKKKAVSEFFFLRSIKKLAAAAKPTNSRYDTRIKRSALSWDQKTFRLQKKTPFSSIFYQTDEKI